MSSQIDKIIEMLNELSTPENNTKMVGKKKRQKCLEEIANIAKKNGLRMIVFIDTENGILFGSSKRDAKFTHDCVESLVTSDNIALKIGAIQGAICGLKANVIKG